MSDLVPLPPRSLDDVVRLGLPDALSGRDGTNRARAGVQQINAETDVEAINVWLSEFPPESATHRAYRKEVQRFYCWVVAYAGKPMSSLRREDIDAYRAFMADPPKHWCGPRNARKTGTSWRPFEGPLSAKSRTYAITVLTVLFTYLVEVQYLAGNPFKVMRRKRKKEEPTEAERKKAQQKHALQKFIPLHTFERLLAALQSECERLDGLGNEHIEMERMLMVVRFLANTGLRREELAHATVGKLHNDRDIAAGVDCWYLTVTGKGDKTEPVAVNEHAMAALRRYQALLDIDPRRADPSTPLVLRVGVRGLKASLAKPMTAQTIYIVVHEALGIAANILEGDHPEDARILREATPHWFRHTFTTIMAQQGHPLPLIQKQLRHASIATTAIYTHTERHQMYHAVNQLKL